jgi:hypothetical protein
MQAKPSMRLALIIAIMLAIASVPVSSEAAYYDIQYSNYIMYNSLASSGDYWSWFYWYYGFAVPSFNYFLAGYYGDLYGYYDWSGYKLYGAGPYWWQYYTSIGDWWWNNY